MAKSGGPAALPLGRAPGRTQSAGLAQSDRINNHDADFLNCKPVKYVSRNFLRGFHLHDRRNYLCANSLKASISKRVEFS
jgi:hypothetical protein